MAKGTARMTGRPLTFAIVVLLVILWAVSGPFFHYSDSWQLTINTFTTIVTDNGTPGSNDTFSITVSNGYSATGKLTSGDILLQ